MTAAFAVQTRRYPLTTIWFGKFTLFLLFGYALLGRGFAYIGVPPIFVGEIGLFLALLTILPGLHWAILRCSVTWLLLLFVLWGAARTIPYVGEYGLDALRDAVLWAYALYAFAVATTLLRLQAIPKVVELYSRAIPIFLLLAPAAFAIYLFAQNLIPHWPWGPPPGVPVVDTKAGDLAVHYSGVFAFLMLALTSRQFQLAWLLLWLVGVAPLVMLSRGAFMTLASTVAIVALLRPSFKYFYVVMCVVVFVSAFALSDVQLTATSGRNISADQLITNVESIFSSADRPELDLQGTKEWREQWWSKIVDYTFYGDYFWTGKGFGVNLADADGFQVEANHALRSPHDVHMTILARAGVPGLTLWIILQLAFAVSLLVKLFTDWRLKRSWLVRVEVWVLIYWMAFLLNGSFDVFFEGPQGGIWFWSLFGLGLALIAERPASAPKRLLQRNRSLEGLVRP